MAYSGTTAATSLANPPIQIAKGMGNTVNQNGAVVGSTAQPIVGGNGLWYYSSVDGTTVLEGVGYFTDGLALGMRNGDALMGVSASSIGSTTFITFLGTLFTTNSTGGFNLSTGGTITSTFT